MRPADDFHEIRAGLYCWQEYDAVVRAQLWSTAVHTVAGLVLIDPIELNGTAWADLIAHETPVAIVLTSANHARAAALCRDRFSIPIFAHPDGQGELGLDAEVWITEGERVLETLEVIRLPGAAAGEMALHSPAAGGVLVVGDALIHLDGQALAFLPDKYCREPKEAKRSLRKLLNFRFELMTFAHGLPIVSGARARLEALLADHDV